MEKSWKLSILTGALVYFVLVGQVSSDELEGLWDVVEVYYGKSGGRPLVSEEFVFEDQIVTFRQKIKRDYGYFSYRYSIKSEKSPKHMDFIHPVDPKMAVNEVRTQCVYELKDSRLVIYRPNDSAFARPIRIPTNPSECEKNHTLFILKRSSTP